MESPWAAPWVRLFAYERLAWLCPRASGATCLAGLPLDRLGVFVIAKPKLQQVAKAGPLPRPSFWGGFMFVV
jgi:hypothetical protein